MLTVKSYQLRGLLSLMACVTDCMPARPAFNDLFHSSDLTLTRLIDLIISGISIVEGEKVSLLHESDRFNNTSTTG